MKLSRGLARRWSSEEAPYHSPFQTNGQALRDSRLSTDSSTPATRGRVPVSQMMMSSFRAPLAFRLDTWVLIVSIGIVVVSIVSLLLLHLGGRLLGKLTVSRSGEASSHTCRSCCADMKAGSTFGRLLQ